MSLQRMLENIGEADVTLTTRVVPFGASFGGFYQLRHDQAGESEVPDVICREVHLNPVHAEGALGEGA